MFRLAKERCTEESSLRKILLWGNVLYTGNIAAPLHIAHPLLCKAAALPSPFSLLLLCNLLCNLVQSQLLLSKASWILLNMLLMALHCKCFMWKDIALELREQGGAYQANLLGWVWVTETHSLWAVTLWLKPYALFNHSTPCLSSGLKGQADLYDQHVRSYLCMKHPQLWHEGSLQKRSIYPHFSDCTFHTRKQEASKLGLDLLWAKNVPSDANLLLWLEFLRSSRLLFCNLFSFSNEIHVMKWDNGPTWDLDRPVHACH